jgi:hypothetical protein
MKHRPPAVKRYQQSAKGKAAKKRAYEKRRDALRIIRAEAYRQAALRRDPWYEVNYSHPAEQSQ